MPTLTPNGLEKLLAAKVARALHVSPEDTLLGFLDVDAETQELVLQFMEKHPFGASLEVQLRQYPATTAYGLAVAAAIGLQDAEIGHGAIYGAWDVAFGFTPSPGRRETLANEFNAALGRLGLQSGTLYPEERPHYLGGCYLFHGAILPHFVGPLRVALDQTIRTDPLPDPDDSKKVKEFAEKLANQVPRTLPKLVRTLRCSVGTFLVRRLVHWHLTGDDTLFPAHIRPLLEEERGRRVFVRAPYITLNLQHAQIELVLPAQNSSVADPQTRWKVPNLRAFRALQDRPAIPLSEFGATTGTFDIELSDLAGSLQDLAYTLQAGIPDDTGFRVFDAENRKERKISPDHHGTIELPPNHSYLILLATTGEIRSAHDSNPCGEWKVLRFDATPGAAPLVIVNGTKQWLFKAKVTQGLYLLKNESQAFRAKRVVDGAPVLVHYASDLGLNAAVPANKQATIRFSSQLDASLNSSIACSNTSIVDGLGIIDVSEKFNQWLDALPAGVHGVTIDLESEGQQPKTEELIYWKDLNRLTSFGDLDCFELPQNLEHKKGFRINGKNLTRDQGRGEKAELGFRGLGSLEVEKWEIPSNQVKVVLMAADGTHEELSEGDTIDIIRDDERLVQFHTGGLLPVQLECADRRLGDLSPSRPVLSFYLSGLEAMYGRAGVIKAAAIGQNFITEPWAVLKWRTPQTALECRSEDAHVNTTAWLIRKVSLIGITKLRLKIVDLGKRLNQEEFESTQELTIPQEGEDATSVDLGLGLNCSVRRIPDNQAQVRLEFIRAEQVGIIRLVDLECIVTESDEWQPVLCMEAKGRLSLTRIIFHGIRNPEPEPTAFTELFWGDPKAIPQAELLNMEELDHWLKTLSWMIECKYPSQVWAANAQRLQSLYPRISFFAYSGTDSQKTVWWRHAVTEFQRHALEAQPVLMPALLLWSNFPMASTSLMGCDLGTLHGSGIVNLSFKEAAIYENRGTPSALSYVSEVFLNRRVDQELLKRFSGFQRLGQGQQAPLGDLRMRDWCDHLLASCRAEGLSSDDGAFPLLSARHFLVCLTKMRRRTDVLLSVTGQEKGHWLGAYMAGVQSSRDLVLQAVRAVLGMRLAGMPPEVLLRPVAESGLFGGYQGEGAILDLMASTILVALLTRARSAKLISIEQLKMHLRTLTGRADTGRDPDAWLRSQISLILGTSPELFSFYYLLFTLTLVP